MLIVNQWVKKKDFNLSLKDLAFIRYQIMVVLDFNETSIRDLADNKRNQWI